MTVSVQPRGRPGSTCIYCRDAVEEPATCAGCQATYHAACLRELGRCATPGCAVAAAATTRPVVTAPVVTAPVVIAPVVTAPAPPGERAGPFVGLALAAFVLVALGVVPALLDLRATGTPVTPGVLVERTVVLFVLIAALSLPAALIGGLGFFLRGGRSAAAPAAPPPRRPRGPGPGPSPDSNDGAGPGRRARRRRRR